MNAAASIDHAASGFLRLRFVRALGASWLVLAILGLGVATVHLAANDKVTNSAELVNVGLGVAGMLAILLLPIFALTAVAGAIIDSLHRRLVALVALPVLWFVAVAAPMAALYTVGQLIGIAPPADFESTGIVPEWAQVSAFAFLMGVSGIVAWEGGRWAWWQLTTSREGFLAARGFRPPSWRLVSSFRRQLGLPPFISSLGRGRVGLTFLYFAEAILNAGVAGMIALPLFFISGADDRGPVIAVAVLGALFVLTLFRAARLIDRLADRRAAQIYQDVREWDSRPPIVFLRSFDQDNEKLPARSGDPFVKLPAGVAAPRTLDEILLEHASVYGPVIAIGDPRDPTPPLGAARIFVPGERLGWQPVVTALVGACKAVVMCPSESEGVKWEIDLITRTGGRARTIYLANPEIPVKTTETMFARVAPEGAAPAIPEWQTPIAAFMDPERGWRVLTTSKPPCVQIYVIALNMALRAVFGDAKLERMSYKPRGAHEAEVARAA